MSRIVLDPNVILQLAHGDIDFAPLNRAKAAGFKLHLGDTAASELLAQLSDRRLPWNSWTRIREPLSEVLAGPRLLLGGREGLQIAGIFSREPARGTA